MRFIADLHIHSHFSIATSGELRPEFLDRWARIKGIGVVATGDFTHPGWLLELKEKLIPEDNGLFVLDPKRRMPLSQFEEETVRFILTAEISTIYKTEGGVRKVHHVLLAPDFGTVEKINRSLSRIGNLEADGRPILGLDSRDLLEIALEASDRVFLIPAHIWTPWFSALGSKSGFDTIEECYRDLTPHIHALETGLSTDPPMNWMCRFLDRFTLISNSDAHSPDRLGRNANRFDTGMDYPSIVDALRTGNPERFLGTIDLFPQEGKYHYDGHRKCGICWDPLTTIRNQGICEKCGKPVTVGVMSRIAELADREEILTRPNRSGHWYIIPLKEILSEILRTGEKSKKVEGEYNRLIQKLGPELHILLTAEEEEIEEGGGSVLSEAIRRMRRKEVVIEDGYDGEYGHITVFKNGEESDIQSLFNEAPNHVPLQAETIRFDLKEYKRLASERGTIPEGQKLMSNGEELSSEQEAAVFHGSGPALVLAGPGTGKTRILTRRIVHLLKSGVSPRQIWAVTFTRKAALEIMERIGNLGIRGTEQVEMTTFHEFGHRFLRRHVPEGRRTDFQLIDDDERIRILNEKESGGPSGKTSMKAIAQHKRQCLEPDGIEDPVMRKEWQTYESRLIEYNLVDLDDLIRLPVRMLDTDESLRKESSFLHILIDEYQDINASQYKLLRNLLGPEKNLFAIGDADQAIYGFRGADSGFIDRFRTDFPESAVYPLNTSYRCSQEILSASGRIIGKESMHGNTGIRIRLSTHDSDRSEAEYVGRTIESLMGGLRFFSMDSHVAEDADAVISSLSEIAVLCRIRQQMDVLEKAFKDHAIPYQKASAESIIKDEKIGALIRILKGLFFPENLWWGRALCELPEEMIQSLRKSVRNKSLRDSIEAINRETRLAEEHPDFPRLLELAGMHGSDLPGFLSGIELSASSDQLQRVEKVSLLTLHAAKGLEFDCVFIVGCEDGLLPYSLFHEPSDPLEEKRLLYVGMTRARRYLFISHASRRTLLGRNLALQPSPFLSRIADDLAERSRVTVPCKKGEDPDQMRLFERGIDG